MINYTAKEMKSLVGKNVRVTLLDTNKGLDQVVDPIHVHEGELIWHKRSKKSNRDIMQLTKVSMGMPLGSFRIEEI